MAKRERKSRKRRRVLLAIIMILFVGVVLTTSTYAWFTANTTVTVSSIDVNVSTSSGLQISADANDWKAILTNNDLLNANWTGIRNQIPNGVDEVTVPVSTVGDVDADGYMQMYRGTVETDNTTGRNILTAVKSLETQGTSGDFIAFDVFFLSSERQMIYLTSESSVVYSGSADKGIQNAARVGFIKEGSVAYGSTPAQAYAIKGNVSKMIWEPNYDVHKASGVANASSVYGVTTSTTGGSKLSYSGVRAPISITDNVPLNSTSSTWFGPVTTVGSVASGIPTTAYLQMFEVEEGITKVRIYMWIEGQDVDCEDHASGSSLTFNLQFSINDKAG